MTDPLTPEEIEQADRLCEETTEGPWQQSLDGSIWRGHEERIYHAASRALEPEDAAFIASARTLVPRLLAAHRAHVERIAELTAENERLRDDAGLYAASIENLTADLKRAEDELAKYRENAPLVRLVQMLGLGEPVRPDIHALVRRKLEKAETERDAAIRERDEARAEVERLRGGSPTIVGETVIQDDERGKVTAIHLSDEAKAALSTHGKRIKLPNEENEQ